MGQNLFHLFDSHSLEHSRLWYNRWNSLSVVLEAANMSVRCCNGVHMASSVIF